MAKKPVAFGVRLRDPERSRTLKIRAKGGSSSRYVIEDERAGEKTRRHEHASLGDAIRKGASIWRHRLH